MNTSVNPKTCGRTHCSTDECCGVCRQSIDADLRTSADPFGPNTRDQHAPHCICDGCLYGARS
jgi:hypothetical protein